MDAITLEAQNRDVTGKKVSQLRREGLIPAIVYGIGEDPRNISVVYSTFEKTYRDVTESTLVDLVIDGKTALKTLVQDVQRDPIIGKFLHIDFRQVDMKADVETEVELVFDGEAPAVKTKGGILVRNMDTVSVRCLPGALVNEIMVDMSALQEIGDSIHVRDLKPPEGIAIIADENDLVAVVNEPISEEEFKALDETSGEGSASPSEASSEEGGAGEKKEGSAE